MDRQMKRVFAASLILLLLGSPVFGSEPLRILLTNDDGITAEGIQTLKDRLEAAGHWVIAVAPDGNASGSSASMHTGETIKVIPVAPGEAEYAVSRVTDDQENIDPVPATPIECLLAASFILDSPPQLIISGINDGHNAGSAAQLSGTVAGAMGGASKLSPFGQLPAISVSLESILPSDPDTPSAEFQKAYGDAADFVVALIARLQCYSRFFRGNLLPKGTFLDINYPARPKEGIRGVKLCCQGETFLTRYDDGSGQFVIRGAQGVVVETDGNGDGTELLLSLSMVEPNEGPLCADTLALLQGWITIVPMRGDYTSGPSTLLRVSHWLGYLGILDDGEGRQFPAP